MTFLSDTRFAMDIKRADTSGRHYEGAYTYHGQVLDFPRFSVWNMPARFDVARTFRVTELSAHTLVIERRWQNIDVGYGHYEPTKYITTNTYTR